MTVSFVLYQRPEGIIAKKQLFMKYIIKFFPEIIVKSKSVRQEMSKVLQRNIRNVLNRSAVKVKIQDCWDKLVVRLDETDGPCPRSSREVAEMLCRIPGIHNVMETEEYEYSSMHENVVIGYSWQRKLDTRFPRGV